MTHTKPDINPVSRYSLKEAAYFLGVSLRTINNWIARDEKSGKPKMKVQYRTANNRPFVTGLEILRVWQQTY